MHYGHQAIFTIFPLYYYTMRKVTGNYGMLLRGNEHVHAHTNCPMNQQLQCNENHHILLGAVSIHESRENPVR